MIFVYNVDFVSRDKASCKSHSNLKVKGKKQIIQDIEMIKPKDAENVGNSKSQNGKKLNQSRAI